MPFELFQPALVPHSSAGLTTEELRRYLGVGRNTITPVAQRFGIEKLHGVYPEYVVWRQLFGVVADNDAAQAALREPLADLNWLSNATGVPSSTIRDHLRRGNWQYDNGIQLGDETMPSPPRLRRWLPALIRSDLCGIPLPQFTRIQPRPVPLNSPDPRPPVAQESCTEQPSDDVFAALLSDPATSSS